MSWKATFEHRHKNSRLVLLALVAATGPATAQTITDLGVLSGATDADARAVSSDGQTVVGSSGARPFRWTGAAGMEDLGSLPGHFGGVASAVSADGSAVAGWAFHDRHVSAFHWTPSGGMRAIVGAGASGDFAQAHGLSADGSEAVGFYRLGGGPICPNGEAWRWTEASGAQYLGALPGYGGSAATAVSDDGSAIAGWSTCEGASLSLRAFRWTVVGGMADLGVLAGEADSAAYAISADGAIVAGASGDRAFAWTSATGMLDIGELPGMFGAIANAISGDGAVIAGGAELSSGRAAFLWTESQGMLDLNAHLPSLGIDLTGWWLHQTTGLNHDGTIIVGNGTYKGEPRAWIVDLGSSCYADCDASGALDFFDFLCFQNLFAAGEPEADCDGSGDLDFFDFLCFQNAFAAGCP